MDKSPKRGRPVDASRQAEKKQALIDAALTLLEEKSYRSISIRDIAQRAGVQSAMVSYYFGSKEGLFLAMIEQKAGMPKAGIQAIANAPHPIRAFIEHALAHFAETPALSGFISDEILHQQSPLGDKFIAMMPGRVAAVLPNVLSAAQKAGEIRADLNPRWAAFSLSNLLVMPFIAAPVREKAWGISLQEITSTAWAEHIYRLFMHGTQATENTLIPDTKIPETKIPDTKRVKGTPHA